MELAKEHPRYGYRRIAVLLKMEGWRVNRKRGHRLWRRHGLKVVVRQHKRRRPGTTENGITRRRATIRNEVWSYDFVMDQTDDGRRLKLLPVVDEHTVAESRARHPLRRRPHVNHKAVLNLSGEEKLSRRYEKVQSKN